MRHPPEESAPPRSTVEGGWIDVSVPLRTGMVHWPGDPAVEIHRVSDMRRGDKANLSHLSMGAHTGTHMDAPGHFLEPGAGIDTAPLDALVGPALVVGIDDPAVIRARHIEALDLPPRSRIVFKTRNSGRLAEADAFVEDFVALDAGAARVLAARKVRTVGVDYLSVGGYRATDGEEVHVTLLSAGIWIIEGLDLSAVRPGWHDLVCLPLRITGADGAPARAIARPLRPS